MSLLETFKSYLNTQQPPEWKARYNHPKPTMAPNGHSSGRGKRSKSSGTVGKPPQKLQQAHVARKQRPTRAGGGAGAISRLQAHTGTSRVNRGTVPASAASSARSISVSEDPGRTDISGTTAAPGIQIPHVPVLQPTSTSGVQTIPSHETPVKPSSTREESQQYSDLLNRALQALSESQETNKELREEVRQLRGESTATHQLNSSHREQAPWVPSRSQRQMNEPAPSQCNEETQTAESKLPTTQTRIRVTRDEYGYKQTPTNLDHCRGPDNIDIQSAFHCPYCREEGGNYANEPGSQRRQDWNARAQSPSNSATGDGMEHVTSHVYALDHERTQARSKYNELKDRYNSLLSRYREVKEEKKALEKKLPDNERDDEILRLRQEHQSVVESLHSRISNLDQEVSNLEDARNNLKAQLTDSEASRKEAEQKARSYKQELEGVKGSTSHSYGFMSSSETQSYAARLEAENEDLKNTNEELLQKLSTVDTCDQRLVELKELLQSMKSELAKQHHRDENKDVSYRDMSVRLMKYQEQILEVVTGIRDTVGSFERDTGAESDVVESESKNDKEEREENSPAARYNKQSLARENEKLREKCRLLRQQHKTGTKLISEIREEISSRLVDIKEVLVEHHNRNVSRVPSRYDEHADASVQSMSEQVENRIQTLKETLQRIMKQAEDSTDAAEAVDEAQNYTLGVMKSAHSSIKDNAHSLESLARDSEHLRISLDRSAINLREFSSYHNDLAALFENNRHIIARAREMKDELHDYIEETSRLRGAVKSSRAEQLRLAGALATQTDYGTHTSSSSSESSSHTVNYGVYQDAPDDVGFLKRENNMLSKLCEQQQQKIRELQHSFQGDSGQYSKNCEVVALPSDHPVNESDSSSNGSSEYHTWDSIESRHLRPINGSQPDWLSRPRGPQTQGNLFSWEQK
eukprot:gb/GECG01006481.1/.p1 GENE.gb/GECG01006481.1/~~gb/GECG01006481.1/.p1  ORF type:complete len:925 (+),score=141.11 gb/GECG01006481.1/:1-2775(+)